MRYHTIKNIADLVGEENIVKAEGQGKYIAITIAGGVVNRQCNICKSGEHQGLASGMTILVGRY
jgi:hypothetical protein